MENWEKRDLELNNYLYLRVTRVQAVDKFT